MSNENGGPAGDGTGGVTRIGNAERESAVALLEVHWHAGRLDPGEHELRVTRAKAAVTQADLDGLFLDLPKPGSAPQSWVPQSQDGPSSGAMEHSGERGPRGGVRETVMALMPFVALAMFFSVGGWMWFLMIPVAGIVLYGADGAPGGRHGWFWGRNRNRGR